MIVADDYGLSQGHDTAIKHLIACQAIDAVSVLVESCSVDSAKAIATTECKIGLHFNLTLALGATHKPKKARLLLLSAFGFYDHIARRAFQEQLNRFTALFGKLPDFIDGHEHCHQYPRLRSIVLDYAKKHHIAVRATVLNHFTMALKPLVLGWLGWRMKRMALRRGVACNALFFGIMALHKPPNARRFAAEYHRYQSAGGAAIMMVHPGDGDDPIQTDGHLPEWRRFEYEFLRNTARQQGNTARPPSALDFIEQANAATKPKKE